LRLKLANLGEEQPIVGKSLFPPKLIPNPKFFRKELIGTIQRSGKKSSQKPKRNLKKMKEIIESET